MPLNTSPSAAFRLTPAQQLFLALPQVILSLSGPQHQLIQIYVNTAKVQAILLPQIALVQFKH